MDERHERKHRLRVIISHRLGERKQAISKGEDLQ